MIRVEIKGVRPEGGDGEGGGLVSLRFKRFEGRGSLVEEGGYNGCN